MYHDVCFDTIESKQALQTRGRRSETWGGLVHHVPADKRAQRSAELVYDALLACLERKTFDRITVSDLQRASGVARSTFYRAFDNVSDILSWKCESCFAEVLAGLGPRDFMNEVELAQRFFAYWVAHSEVLDLLTRIGRLDIALSSHLRSAESLQDRFGGLPGMTGTQEKYFMAIRSGILMSVLGVWMQGGRKESPQELTEVVRSQLAMAAGCPRVR